MDISIIILNYKQKGLIKQCVRNIYTNPPCHSFEIIVVDNASDDGVGEMLHEQFPKVIFVESSKNLGYAGGNNLGIRQAKGKAILILNPDIFVKKNAIDLLYEQLFSREEIGVAGPQLLYPDGSVQMSCYRFPSYMTPVYRRTFLGKLPKGKKHVDQYVMKDFDHMSARKVDWLLGASLMIKHSVLEQVGMLDERYFLYYEDVDWCRQCWHKGYEVWYVASSQMIHFHQRLSGSSKNIFSSLQSKATRIHIKSAVSYFMKYRKSDLPTYIVSERNTED